MRGNIDQSQDSLSDLRYSLQVVNSHFTCIVTYPINLLGREVGNSYSELTDPLDQRNRLEEQLRLKLEAQKLNGDKLSPHEVTVRTYFLSTYLFNRMNWMMIF